MKKLFILLLLASCTPSKKENHEQSSDSVTVKKDSTSTSDWRILFDGKSFDGWKFFKDRKNNSWEIQNGTLHRTAIIEDIDDRPDLITVDEFENFELVFDWKISSKGNSGVMFRSSADLAQPYLSGPEYQVKDDIGFPEDPIELKEAGANYDMHAPTNKVLKPVGEWNTGKIVANGKHVEHWLNGTKILEYELESPDWQSRKAKSKWKNVKTYGIMTKGHVVLQDHGQEVWYKNIMIKPL